jgi:hypothetical protein
LLVEVSKGEWVSAVDAANDLGPFSVVTGDNPFSQHRDGDANAQRRVELRELLNDHDVMVRPTIARDPTGEWPDEEGFALLEKTPDFAKALARAFEQFAFYDVNEDEVLVRACADGEALV